MSATEVTAATTATAAIDATAVPAATGIRDVRVASPTIAQGASVIAGVTVVSRLAGFIRTAVLGQALGATFLGNTYATANTVPNVLYEVVAGGALASLVVPVLARPAASLTGGDEVRRTTSALLTWTLLALVPLTVIAALLAHPVMSLLVGSAPPGRLRSDEVDVGARMLVIFMPQMVLYGVGIICSGVLQAHRRFLAPALAPLVSSVAVTAAYLIFMALPTGAEVTTVSRTGELVLAVGTTLGVVALTATVLIPVLGMRLRLRPRWQFPPGVALQIRRLAVAGAAVLLAQQASVAVALRLANPQQGAVLVFTLATAVFLLPWAVLAVPVASSAFPVLSAAAAEGDRARYEETVLASCRAVLIGTLLAAGLLIGCASPVARMLLAAAPGAASAPAHLAAAIRALSVGLVGFGILAVASRALYADARARAAGTATVIGWLVVLIADVVLTQLWAGSPRATLLGVGNTLGMTMAGLLLLAALRVRARSLARTAGAGVLAAAGAALVGLLVARMLSGGGTAQAVVAVAVAGGLSVLAGVTVLQVLARDEMRSALQVLRR
jgi:putative peptidoglycan lipid II flippase